MRTCKHLYAKRFAQDKDCIIWANLPGRAIFEPRCVPVLASVCRCPDWRRMGENTFQPCKTASLSTRSACRHKGERLALLTDLCLQKGPCGSWSLREERWSISRQDNEDYAPGQKFPISTRAEPNLPCFVLYCAIEHPAYFQHCSSVYLISFEFFVFLNGYINITEWGNNF